MRPVAKALMVLGTACVLLGAVPVPARAQAYLTPFIGWDFGGDAGTCESFFGGNCSNKRTNYGVAVGSGGIVGFELEFAYAPDFFGQSAALGSNSVLTLMGNLQVTIPAGPVHPYVTGGAGLFRTHVAFTAADILSFSDSSFGYNFGGGVMILLPAHLGVRGDFRNIRSASDISILGTTISGTKLSFSRFYVGLVVH